MLRSPGHRRPASPPHIRPFAWSLLGAFLLLTAPALALVHIDFEQKYFVHPGIQTWDFCIVRDQGIYHIFYTSIPEEEAHSSYADSLRHAWSSDLENWHLEGPVLAVNGNPWEAGALWAPDVFWDEDE